MTISQSDINVRPDYDHLLSEIAAYACEEREFSNLAVETARFCLADSLACALMALDYPACEKLLGGYVDGSQFSSGARVPGTSFELDPVQAAFNIGCTIRWLDFNDTWLAAEWGHPSDNLGTILALADYLNRARGKNFTLKEILNFMIKAHEIQGVLALENSFNRVGLDHVLLVRVASSAIAAAMLGLSKEKCADTLSHAFADGACLRTYRHAPNSGPRKSWAAGDATSRATLLALMVEKGEGGYPGVLSAKQWGFQDVLFKGKEIKLARELDSYVMENVLFKISFPAEFHAQTAVECAIKLHEEVKDRLQDIARINIETHESAIRIISKSGKLYNPADRDHCLQYMVAVPLIYGSLRAEHYEDEIAADSRIDELRELMIVNENKEFSKDYLDPNKRSIANSMQIEFKDGSKTDKLTIEYPIGHRRRRQEGIPNLMAKFSSALKAAFPEAQAGEIEKIFSDQENLLKLRADDLMDKFVKV